MRLEMLDFFPIIIFIPGIFLSFIPLKFAEIKLLRSSYRMNSKQIKKKNGNIKALL